MDRNGSGHVFVVGADLTRLSCDDVLVPTDRASRVATSWSSLVPQELVGDPGEGGPVDDIALEGLDWSDGGRVLELKTEGPRRTWLVDTVDYSGGGLPWLLEGAREALAAVAEREVDVPLHRRARRLVGLPALGTGWGGAAGQRGELLRRLLPVLQEAAAEHGFDVALVLKGRSDLAAAQQVRRSADFTWDLPSHLQDLARQLGDRARRGELAVFVGAGVSAAAGLPDWEQMILEMAELAGLEEELRGGLERLPPQDAAALVARELGRERLEQFIKNRFGPGTYSLAHALIAGLPVQEFVTTNYDPLVECAAVDIERPMAVLPFDDPEPGQPWLLKQHGDAAHPESIVLTREEYLHLGDARAALAGVLHSLLLTRHVLFVGTSLLDDDLIRIAHEVRLALQVPDGSRRRRMGTVLNLREDRVRARLWERDVESVAMGPAGTPAAEAARRLEVLLDLMGCLATPPTGYLLDPAYRGLLSNQELALAELLARVAAAVPDGRQSSWASEEVVLFLRRLGFGVSHPRARPDGGQPGSG